VSSSDDLVRSHYDRNPESLRLLGSPGRLEFERTKALIARSLPPGKLDILDLGGATGAYSFWLSEMGHRLTLIDISDEQIRLTRHENARRKNPLVDIRRADAREVSYHAAFDVVLNMGPMYHLQDEADRQTVLKRCLQALRPNGVLFCAYISRCAALLDGYRSGYIQDPAYREIVDRDLACGAHSPPADDRYFTEAFFHHPDEIRNELASAGFRVVAVHSVEGPFWLLHDLPEHLSDENKRALLLAYLDRISEDASIAGASAHLLSVSHAGAEAGRTK
jgi:SAM-dependent methyltransferase